jgi:hypothetical protein
VTGLYVSTPAAIPVSRPVGTLVVVSPDTPAPVVLREIAPPKKAPYVAPVLKPKPYRN